MILVLMPAFNEEDGLDDLLERMPRSVGRHPVEIRLLDDGSTDDTAGVARRAGHDVISSSTNRGKGATLKLAIASLDEGRWDAVALMDTDGQHAPEDLPRIVAPILRGEADMVVGSRYFAETGRGCAPWNRYAVRCITVAMMRRTTGIAITDPFSGFRALSLLATRRLDLRGDHYECELEMAFSMGRHDMRITEVPIAKVYGEGMTTMGSRYGSFFGRIHVILGYARTIAREWRKMSAGRPIDRVGAGTQ